MSDYLGRRKGLAVFGYALGAVSKPLFAIAPTIGILLTARLLDRVGKGIRGAAFGMRQSLDTGGAFLGSLLAVGLLLFGLKEPEHPSLALALIRLVKPTSND